MRLKDKFQAAKQKKQAAKRLQVLIDGSGSMQFSQVLPQSPLKLAIEATQKLAQKSAVDAAFWGADRLFPLELSADTATLTGRAGNWASNIMPALDHIEAAAARGARHFILVSDGDLFDNKKVLDKTRATLRANPDMTIDFLIMPYMRPHALTQVEMLAKILCYDFESQVRYKVVTEEKDVAPTLGKFAKARTARGPLKWAARL